MEASEGSSAATERTPYTEQISPSDTARSRAETVASKGVAALSSTMDTNNHTSHGRRAVSARSRCRGMGGQGDMGADCRCGLPAGQPGPERQKPSALTRKTEGRGCKASSDARDRDSIITFESPGYQALARASLVLAWIMAPIMAPFNPHPNPLLPKQGKNPASMRARRGNPYVLAFKVVMPPSDLSGRQ